MKFYESILVMGILLIWCSGTVSAYRIICECTGTCHGGEIKATGMETYTSLIPLEILEELFSNPLHLIDPYTAKKYTDLVYALGTAQKNCLEKWGTSCGGLTNYLDDSTNCDMWCQGLSDDVEVVKWSVFGIVDLVDIKADVLASCKKACESKCGLNETIHSIVSIIYYIAGIIAAIMLVINGYKFITSTTPEDRDDAKKGVVYIILALIIITIAGSLVDLLMGGVALPGGPNIQPDPKDLNVMKCVVK